MVSEKPSLIEGNFHSDERGSISFFNEFDMSQVARMYVIDPEHEVVRAWQGHKIESKWFAVLEGEFLIQAIPLDSEIETKTKDRFQIKLSKEDYKILYIPPGYYNGFQAIEPNSKLLVLSDVTVAESIADDYRLTTAELNW